MDSTTALVVKVSYGGVLRRFRVPFKANGQLDLDMASLRGKIAALFNLSPDADFSLTYSDEDGDVVALVDDNDLFDVTNQRLKFLKINVQSNAGVPAANSVAPESSGSSSASGLPDIQNPVSKIQKGFNDAMMAVPNPMRDTISKVYIDLTSKAAASSPVVGELFDCINKLGKLSIPQESSPCPPVTKPGSSGPSLSREVPSAGEKKDVSKKTQAGKKPASLNVPVTDSTSSGLGASFNECPFGGSPVIDSSPNPTNLNKHPRRVCHSKKTSNGDYWASLGVFHKGIRCDGCGVLPITGPRFKSKVKEDYDLCTICFSVMGNDGDYTRMDMAVSAQHPHPFRGLPTPFSNPWLGHVPRPHHGGLHYRCTRPKLDSRFVLDVNVLDGTVVAPSAPFTKIWKMRNNGSLVWPHGTQIVWIGGDRFSSSLSVDLQIPVEGVPINSELDVKVEFVAPESPGRYISYWRMASSNGAKFGQRVWVLINVDASLKGSVVNEFHGLNLNDYPDENINFAREYSGINVNHVPAQHGSPSVNPGTVKGATDLDPEASSGSNNPIKDDLVAGEVEPAVPNTLTPSSSSSSFNIIECSNMPTTVEALGGGSSSTKNIPVPLQEDIEKNDVEITMLKELEEMGFKEIDLNKEILRDNEYNLEQSVDALCGVSDWDPILEELQEMGFCDDVTNKRLLKKNNGSIKGVVMDLLTGEKEA
ncbi:Protein NBR1 [Hirschfeldia incana]|nr:Protein NBR1 [Hirschfeldia incana]